MMVSSSSNMDLSAILQTLESKKTNVDDKIEAYANLSSHLKEEELSFTSLDLTKQADRVLTILKKDIQSDNNNVQQGALQILGFCLHDVDIVRSLSPSNSSQLLALLQQCVEKTDDKTVATRALWCLSKQKLADAVIGKELLSLLEACEHAFTKWKGQSTAVHEAINAVFRFVEQVPAEMKTHCSKWGRHTVPLAVHPAIKIREKSLALLESTVSWLSENKELRQALVPEFKSKICAELKKLFVKNEVYVLRIWKLVVKMFAEELHHGSFINSILPVAELGFKHASPEVKIEAFKAWKYLIDNFSLNPNIVCDPKRVKLVMQVFKINNAKVESVAKQKLKTWWHFVRALGAKISQNFDQVVVPLLHFCLGGTKTGATSTTPGTPLMGMKNMMSSPATPRLNLSVCSPGLWRPVFSSIQIQGCEVLARILACPSRMTDLPRTSISLESLTCEVLASTQLFLKHSSVIVSTTLDLICAQGSHIPESLLHYIWQCLIYHLHLAIESSSKSENREALSCFLIHLQTLVFSQSLSTKIIMKLLQPVCTLPQRALSSTAYSINSGEVVRGTPALFLCELLLAPTLLKDLSASENYISLFTTLINCGTSNMSGVLEFCQAVLEVISRHASFITNPESLWRFWSILANTLEDHIVKTNEVNQGDSLEYNFDCMYAALLLPIRQNLGTKLSQPVCKSMLKTWGELYHTFARLSALVTNAEANIACEELCHKVLHHFSEDETKDIGVVEMLAQMCQIIIDNVDFSSLGQTTPFSHGASLSPSKWIKRKHKPMENIQSYVKLLVRLLEDLASLTEEGETTPASKQRAVNVTAPAVCLVDVLSTLFTHITVSNIIAKVMTQLAPPTSWFYSASARKSCSRLFSSAFMQKLDKLWLDISTCIQSRYTMPYDSDFLASVSPLLVETMLHPRRQIKNQALILWKATFSHSAPLIYPDQLRPVLLKVKEKTPILLPGWVCSDTAVIEETPLSQFSQMDSQAPTPHLPGLPSPHKILGSFMHKAVSPNIKKSPAKPSAPEPSSVNTVKKRLSVGELRDEDFVVIKASPKKKRVLTEHQKEVLKERRSLPVMYNNLDLSQDVSLMSQFNTDTQQESILVPSQSQNDSVIVISSSQSQNQEQEKSKLSSSESDDTTEPRRGRRRSARFSTDEEDTNEKKGNKSEMKAPLPATRSLRSRKDTTGAKEDKEGKKMEVEEDELSQKPQDVEADVNRQESVDVNPSPSLKQNLLHAIGDQWLNTLSSKTSSSSAGKSDSSQEGKTSSGSDKESEKNSQKSSSSSQSSQEETAKPFSPFKSLSQSPPERKPRSPGRKTRSQEYSSSFKSPRKARDKSQSGSLDRWLVKSPAKSKSPGLDKSPDDSFVPNTQSPTENRSSLLLNVVEDTMSPKKEKTDRSSHSFVEDTQSPSKFTQNKFSPDVNASIEETPTKAVEDKIEPDAVVPSRVLFSEENINSQDDDNLDGEMSLVTPVLKIKKLTSEEIVELSHSSPEKDVSKAIFKEPEPIAKPVMEEDSQIPCSQGFPTSSGDHEPESQISSGFPGLFDTQKSTLQDSEEGFTGILSAEQREELSHASTSSSSTYSTSVVNTSGVGSQECSDNTNLSQKSELSQKDDNFTEDLFKTCPTEMETDAYNPDAESTLKEGSSQSSGSSKGSSQTSGSSQCSQESVTCEAATEDSFNPDELSTLAEDSGQGRKRKQDTPKKIGESDLRRTPRRRKKKNFDGFEVETPSASKDGKTESTPARKGVRTPGGRKKKDDDENEVEGSQGSTNTRRSSRTPTAKKTENKVEMETESEKDEKEDKIKQKRQKTTEDVTKESKSSQESQENSERDAKRKTRKRKLDRDDSDSEDLPLSQIIAKSDSKLDTQGEDKADVVEDSGVPKKKRVRKSLAAEMTDSESRDTNTAKSESSQEASQKPRRIQLQPVVKTNSDENNSVFKKDVENSQTLKKVEDAGSNERKDNIADSSVGTESCRSGQESQSVQFSEIILVGMEMDSSKSLNEQTPEESQTESEEVMKEGESTPSSKPSPAPVRRSTTKQKMEEARKRSISKKTDKNDDGSVEDATEWANISVKTSIAETEVQKEAAVLDLDNKTIDTQTDFLDSQLTPKPSAVANLDMSFCKESPRAEQEQIKGTIDNIISSLESPVLESKKGYRKRKRNVTKPKVASPLSVRLRSSRLVLRARAKLGSKTVSKASPLSLGHLRKISQKSGQKPAENANDFKDEETVNSEIEKSGNEVCVPLFVENEGAGDNVENKDSVENKTEMKNDLETVKPCVKNDEKSAASSDNSETQEETPRKTVEKIRHNRLAHANRAFSDSKVLSLNKLRNKNRMTDRGMSIVRRSILKHRQFPDAKSPSKRSHDPDFQPIRVFQFHSPSASPSAGILKKKRLSVNAPVSCSSPPAKERRVSFAEPIISGASPHRTSGPELVKSKNTLGKKAEEVAMDSQPSQSQASYKSTQESQLNCTDPVYPDLVECTESVTKVLPQLTSSVWSRGLGQLVKARNIHTVGDLSKLTEVDIHNLPIRSPKVVTVRRVLSDLEQHLEVRRSRDVKSAETDVEQADKTEASTFKVPGMCTVAPLDTIEESCEIENKENRGDQDEPDTLPNMDDALSQLAPKPDDLNTSIEAETEEPMSLDNQPSQSQSLTQNPSQSEAMLETDSHTVCQDSKLTETSDNSEIRDGESLAKTLDSLVKETDFKKLQKMRTGDLFQVHQNLTHLSNLVITAMKSRCHSPPSSQE